MQNLALVQGVVQLASKKGCTPGQLALAWVQVRPKAGQLTTCDKLSELGVSENVHEKLPWLPMLDSRQGLLQIMQPPSCAG